MGRRRISGAQLSGGEQQMLAIGCALLTNPRLLRWTSHQSAWPRASSKSSSRRRTLVSQCIGLPLVEHTLAVATAGSDLTDRSSASVSGSASGALARR